MRYPINIHKAMILSICILIVFILVSHSQSQTITAEVKMIIERLSQEKQEKLKDFAETIEEYINNHDWTGESSDEEIPVRIQIFLKDKSVSYEERYSGTFLISNKPDAQYYDKYWFFPYRKGDMLDHGIFHPLTGFIDFYVNIIIGCEYDKYGKFFGTPFFEKARSISEQGLFGTQYAVGWRERSQLIDDILSDEHKAFRSMKDLFYLGKSYVGEEDTTAQKYCKDALIILNKLIKSNPDDKESTQFLQAHYMEFVDLLKDDSEVMEMMMRLDPNRAEVYEQYLD